MVKEQGKEMRGTYRNASVRLSAAKPVLTKGERTTLTAKVEGLDGMSTPALLRLTLSGPVRMEGGNEQMRMILPFEVKDDGSFTLNRTITALQAGGFNASGKVNLLGVCLQDDKDSHSLYFSQDTGAYMFCPKKGDAQSGSGAVNISQCETTLDDSRADRKLHAVADRCNNRGTADLEFDSGKKKFSIRDRDLKNNVCGCK